MRLLSSESRSLLRLPSAYARPRTRWLLALVALMAAACSVALWVTVQQASQLGKPHQHSDLWYVANINSEFARVDTTARQWLAGESDAQELRLRLEVLYSTLVNAAALPQPNDPLHGRLPKTTATLNEISTTVNRWLEKMDQDAAAQARGVAMDIVGQSPQIRPMTRAAMSDVHQAVTEDIDNAREGLHTRYVILSALLAGLLLGTAALTWHLLRVARNARYLSRTMRKTNQRLESRVSERTRQIEEGRLLLSFILNASPSDVLLIASDDGTVIFINQRLVLRLGMTQEPERLHMSELLPIATQCQSLLDALDRYGEMDAMEALIGHQHPIWCSLSARLIEVDGRLCHLIWSFDISQHKRLEAQLRELASTDALSGLSNRRSFLERGSALLDHCRRHHQDCAVVMIDIDHFKSINDHHGHAVGDQAIVACSQALRLTLRDADVLGRLGGEEFAALLPLANEQAALETAERLRRAVQALQIPLPQGGTLSFTVSLGVAPVAARSISLEVLLMEADHALYQAKSSGRNRVVAHTCEAIAPPHFNALP